MSRMTEGEKTKTRHWILYLTGSSITNVEDDRGGEDKDKTLDPLLDWIHSLIGSPIRSGTGVGDKRRGLYVFSHLLTIPAPPIPSFACPERSRRIGKGEGRKRACEAQHPMPLLL